MSAELYRGPVYAVYGQVALFNDGPDLYPQWETGAERAILTPKGVAVATASDIDIEVVVCTGEKVHGLKPCLSGEIRVGNQGLLVGNVISCDLHHIALPPGRISVTVYVDGNRCEATQVVFVLGNLAGWDPSATSYYDELRARFDSLPAEQRLTAFLTESKQLLSALHNSANMMLQLSEGIETVEQSHDVGNWWQIVVDRVVEMQDIVEELSGLLEDSSSSQEATGSCLRPDAESWLQGLTRSPAHVILPTLRTELLTPLRLVLGYAELMIKCLDEGQVLALTDRLRYWCERVLDSARAMQDLIEGLTHPRHRDIARQEWLRARRRRAECQWKQTQAELPELQDHSSFLAAVLRTACKLDLSIDHLDRVLGCPPGGFIVFTKSKRNARIHETIPEHQFVAPEHRRLGPGYFVSLAELIGEADTAEWELQGHGLTKSLDEAVTLLHRWLEEQRKLEQIRREFGWLA
jgi:hypothetical protein